MDGFRDCCATLVPDHRSQVSKAPCVRRWDLPCATLAQRRSRRAASSNLDRLSHEKADPGFPRSACDGIVPFQLEGLASTPLGHS